MRSEEESLSISFAPKREPWRVNTEHPDIIPQIDAAAFLAIGIPLWESFELLLEGSPGTVQAGSNRSYGDSEDIGDLFVSEIFHFPEHEDGPVIFRHEREGLMDQLDILVSRQTIIGGVSVGHRLAPGVFAGFIQGENTSIASPTGKGEIESDSVNPSKESTVLLESVQFEISLNEGFLDDIFRFVRVANDADHGGIQAVLVPSHQRLKGCTLAI